MMTNFGKAHTLPPVGRPGKIICVGMNYPPAAGTTRRVAPEYPVLFQKPASGVIGHGEAIVLPGISKMVLYEGELAVVIGECGKNLAEENALKIVAGFTIANDVGAADIEARSSQWASGKMFDTFCPLGPNLVLKDDVKGPERLTIRTWLNDQLVQDGRTSQMIFRVSYLVSYISHLTTLEPGDVILTGSPKSVGTDPDPRIPLKPGDEIRVEIEGLGELHNPVISEEQADE